MNRVLSRLSSSFCARSMKASTHAYEGVGSDTDQSIHPINNDEAKQLEQDEMP